MTTKQRSILVNFNRVLIFTLTLTGLLMDVYQHSDLPVTLALGIWLWLAVCTRMEANILSRARYHPASSRNRGVRLRRTAGANQPSANGALAELRQALQANVSHKHHCQV